MTNTVGVRQNDALVAKMTLSTRQGLLDHEILTICTALVVAFLRKVGLQATHAALGDSGRTVKVS